MKAQYTEDCPAYISIMSRIEQMSESVFKLMKLHDDEDSEYEFDFKKIERLYDGRMP